MVANDASRNAVYLSDYLPWRELACFDTLTQNTVVCLHVQLFVV
jgi:hypothetical protein